MAATIAVPFWAVGMLLFVFGVFVGKILFQPPGVPYTRPPTPPNPYPETQNKNPPPSYPRPPMPHQSACWQPTCAGYPAPLKPPPKQQQICVEKIEEDARKTVEAFKGIEGSIGTTGDALGKLFKDMKHYGER